jgi:hypothetical protein
MRADKHTDRRTDRLVEAIVAFRNFANAPKNYAIEMKKINVYVRSARPVVNTITANYSSIDFNS